MFYGATNFNQNLSKRNVDKVEVFDFTGWMSNGVWQDLNLEFLSGSALSTYNYNQILSGWSQQNVQS
jgi:hypothetical protein